MKLFTTLTIASFIASGIANAAVCAPDLRADIGKYVAKSKSASGMNARRMQWMEDMNARIYGHDAIKRGPAVEADKYSPAVLGPTSTWGDLDGPGGKTWFYALDIESDAIEHEYYTEYVSRFWTLSIFDENMNPVTTLKDKVRYEEGEKRTVLLEPLPIITKNYFNNDDKYEVLMSFGINFTPGHNHYRSIVYQIGGEKDEEGNDKMLYALDELIADVVTTTGADGKEEVYMTMMYDNAYIPEEFDWSEVSDKPDFWEAYCRQDAVFNIFKKTGDMERPQLILRKGIPYANSPGSQENSPLISTTANGKAYMAFSYYKEPLFNPFYSWTEDFSQREENSLMVEVYELGETAELIQTTEIPFAKANEDLLAKYYSVGDFRWSGDINFTDYDSNGLAALIVTEGRQNRGEESPSEFTYYIYNPDGTLRSTIFDGAESHKSMADLDGFEPQELFITTEYGEYIFNFVDLISCKKSASFSYLIEIDEDSDPDGMTVNIERVKQGNSYMYVDEMRMPIDVDDYTWMRIAWLDKKGNFDHMDYVNMGANVHYAMSYITEPALHPEVFHSDAAQEYMMLIKRGVTDEATGQEIRVEELLIAQPVSDDYPDGRDILYLPAHQFGALSNIMPYTFGSNPRLAVTYYDRESNSYLCESYSLPLDQASGIMQPEIEKNTIADNQIIANGVIGIYTLQGAKVATGAGKVDMNALPEGMYIVKSAGGVKKVVKK